MRVERRSSLLKAGPWLLVLAATLIRPTRAQVDYDCDFLGTTCPEIFLFNGVCESEIGDADLNPCYGSDCVDCDPCKEFQADCNACVSNGCVWCPGDAYCSSVPLGREFWVKYVKISTCALEEEWLTTCEADPEGDNVFNDPLYEAQKWVYESMNVEPVWRQGITGAGVIVRVNDPHGVDTTIPELSANFDEASSCDQYLPPEINIPGLTLSHGTEVASIALGAADNSECAAGVAPGATLSACWGPTMLMDSDVARFFTDGFNNNIDISINSWGFDACKLTPAGQASRRDLQTRCPFDSQTTENPCYHPYCSEFFNQTDCLLYTVEYCQQNFGVEQQGCAEFLDEYISCEYNVLSAVGRDAITQGITQGRDGKGIIYVFASGNENGVGEVVNMEGWLNTRFTITVGAVGKNGYVASYSTPGAALFIAGPGGDKEFLANHITGFPGGAGCVDADVGTSFATPAVAGAIALMLEANPNLTWRDVQGILALTAQRVYRGDDSWSTNGAGISHSYKFGFGVMDALAAVGASQTWQSWGPEQQIMMDSQPINIEITDGDYITSTMFITPEEVTNVTGASSMSVESVVLYLHLNHSSRGDMEISLTSPNGTKSILVPGHRPENTVSQEQWKLMTVRNWGENPVGGWSLGIIDKNTDNTQCSDLAYSLPAEDIGGEISCRLIEEMLPANETECPPDLLLEGSVELGAYADVKSPQDTTYMEACCRCGGGIPSSSVSNTLVSWQLVVYGHGAPPPGANDAVLSVPCQDSCDLDFEFCGTDDKCHAVSCDDWFRFGPVNVTGYDPDTPAKLECYDYAGGDEDNNNAVIYGCSGVLPFGATYVDDVVPFFFNRLCNATMPQGLLFQCFDVRANTSFADYVNEVDTSTPPTCDAGVSPMYHYTQMRRNEIDGNRSQVSNPRSSASFNESMAATSLISILKNGQDECYPSGPLACPFTELFDGYCNAECVGDCFDCDPCMELSYTDCDTCTQSGCAWCPGDAICQSEPLGQLFWAKYEGQKKSSCGFEQVWVYEGGQRQCGRTEGSAFADPLYDAMAWSYKLINVEDVWSAGILGTGVHIRVNDDGVAADHPEFTPNFDVENSCVTYLPVDPEGEDTHGTACASLIGASTNDVCAVGIANGATLSACTLSSAPGDYAAEAEMFLTKLDAVDISSNSWGPSLCESPYLARGRRRRLWPLEDCPFSVDNFDSPCATCEAAGSEAQECVDAVSNYCLSHFEDDAIACAEYLDLFVSLCQYHMLPPELHDTFVKAIQEGRGGKGVIFVFAAGNDFSIGVDTNMDGYINSRFTIAVGAVGKDGYHASYSTRGAAVFVAGPGGDDESVSNNIVANPVGGCRDATIGTSFAAPAVSGVIALVLEKNPDLTWRDVQAIIASTSYQMDPDDESWSTNAAGYNHSYLYGFGIVDAMAAVNAAGNWTTLPPEKPAEGSSGEVNIPIPDAQDLPEDAAYQPITSTVAISATTDYKLESATAYVKLSHPARGDLQITLISPSGVESILTRGGRPEYQQLAADEDWKLMTLRNWGESPNGEWTLRIVDLQPGRLVDCVDTVEWEYDDGEQLWVCSDFDSIPDCTNAEQVGADLASSTYEDLTAAQACCACGGGIDLTTVQSTLVSWRLMLYGHEDGVAVVQPTETVVNGNSTTPTDGTPPGTTTSGNGTNPTVLADPESGSSMSSFGSVIALTTAACLLSSGF